MARHAGVSGSFRRIKKKISRRDRIPGYQVSGENIRAGVKTRMASAVKDGRVAPGAKISPRPGEDARALLKRLKKVK